MMVSLVNEHGDGDDEDNDGDGDSPCKHGMRPFYLQPFYLPSLLPTDSR